MTKVLIEDAMMATTAKTAENQPKQALLAIPQVPINSKLTRVGQNSILA
jgi:hypothetical protein